LLSFTSLQKSIHDAFRIVKLISYMSVIAVIECRWTIFRRQAFRSVHRNWSVHMRLQLSRSNATCNSPRL